MNGHVAFIAEIAVLSLVSEGWLPSCSLETLCQSVLYFLVYIQSECHHVISSQEMMSIKVSFQVTFCLSSLLHSSLKDVDVVFTKDSRLSAYKLRLALLICSPSMTELIKAEIVKLH